MIVVSEMFSLSSAAHVAIEVEDQVEDPVEEERSDGPGISWTRCKATSFWLNSTH